jgi:N-acetylglucosamine-6-phosphate deacetylase
VTTIGGPADPEHAGTTTRVPGFVDLQVNGGFGHDFTSDPDSIWEVAALLPRTGVTAFVPTIITSPAETALAALEIVRNGPPAGWVGATPLGVHLEGPMISARKRGAHPAELVASLTPELVDRLIAAGPPLMVTIAPELEGAEAVIRTFTAAGTVVSLGHSEATAAQAGASVDWGARHVTHLFNAMSGLDHRRPGLAAAVLIDPRLTAGLIADGVHVAPEMLRLAFQLKGSDGLALVTDAMAAMATDDGTHLIGSVEVTVEGMEARNVEGALAGSLATMDHVVRTMIAATGCSLDEASTMASATPLRVVGQTADGADIVTLDADLRVVATEISGRVVYDGGPS